MANQQDKKTSESGESSTTKQASKGTLAELFVKELNDIYSAEKQLAKSLPELAKICSDEELEEAFKVHAEETQKQIERLEKIFRNLRIDRQEEPCLGMQGLVEEVRKLLKELEEGPVRDAAIIIAAQKIEHYEIAAYGSLCELADVLGYHKVSDLLGRTLEEEENTDELLSEIAQDINEEALEYEGEQTEA